MVFEPIAVVIVVVVVVVTEEKEMMLHQRAWAFSWIYS